MSKSSTHKIHSTKLLISNYSGLRRLQVCHKHVQVVFVVVVAVVTTDSHMWSSAGIADVCGSSTDADS